MEHPDRPLEIEEWEALAARGELPGPMDVHEYTELGETDYREELLMGWRVREPAPVLNHQVAMSNLVVLVGMHLIDHSIGVIVAPACDIVFDEEKRLILVPDAAVILNDRMHIMGGKRLHAPPNLVVEALSPSTSRRDRVDKLEWYAKYGVDEYWIVDQKKKRVEVFDLTAAPAPSTAVFGEPDTIVSRVLPDLQLKVEWLFGPLNQRALETVFSPSRWSTPSTSRARRKRKPRYDTDPA
jgi:Uma2 family endonuclease